MAVTDTGQPTGKLRFLVVGGDAGLRMALAIGFLIVTWRFGDWRNWQKYHSTLLFFILSDLLYNFMLYNYPMWQYSSDGIIPTHTLSALLDEFVDFPCTGLLFLPYFPKTRVRQVVYIVTWGVIYSAIEMVAHETGIITYHNGWTYLISALFDIGIFLMLIIHHKRPLLAYALSFATVVCLMLLYKVPIHSMK